MESIKKSWAELIAKINALSLRERGMIVGALIAAVYGPWDALFNVPIANEHKRLEKSLKESQKQLTELNKSINGILVSSQHDPNNEVRAKLKRLDAELVELNEHKEQLAKSFISPQLMAELLRDLLKGRAALRLIQLKTLPAVTVELTSKQAESAAQAMKKPQSSDTVAKDSAVPVIYRHSLEIEFEGGYFDILEYLRASELQPLFWEGIAYQVSKYPQAKVLLKVYTLSFEQAWLGV